MTSAALVVFWPEYLYFYPMTIEQKKISLIKWIATLEDEVILDQMAGFKELSLGKLPDSIVQLLKMAEAEPDENLVKHTSAKNFLKMK
jgi:hypothetical protein